MILLLFLDNRGLSKAAIPRYSVFRLLMSKKGSCASEHIKTRKILATGLAAVIPLRPVEPWEYEFEEKNDGGTFRRK
jgi:hypothetical protein